MSTTINISAAEVISLASDFLSPYSEQFDGTKVILKIANAVDGDQLQAAQVSKKQAADELKSPIATEIAMASFWTDSEGYHQNYYKKNPIRYKYYRYRCGRDQRVKQLWGDQAYTGVNYGS